MEVKVGNKVNSGDVLAFVHANDRDKLNYAKKRILQIIKVGCDEVDKLRTILEII